jgi:hypothetical protein
MTLVIPWIIGIAVAQGPISTFFAFILPPYAWVLTAMHWVG